MRFAIPVWDGRVSPVLDVARSFRIADIESGELVKVETLGVGSGTRVSMLVELGVDCVLCSAVSVELEAILRASGLRVVSRICGSPEEIFSALASGDVELERFRSPGSAKDSMPSRRGRHVIVKGGSEPPS